MNQQKATNLLFKLLSNEVILYIKCKELKYIILIKNVRVLISIHHFKIQNFLLV